MKPGDRVKILYGSYDGQIGVVKEIDDHARWPVRVHMGVGQLEMYDDVPVCRYAKEEVEKVK